MRIGFDDTAPFERMLDLINEHGVDLLSVHGRTVKEMYRSEVHYDFIARAAARARCPVLANGNVTSADRASRRARRDARGWRDDRPTRDPQPVDFPAVSRTLRRTSPSPGSRCATFAITLNDCIARPNSPVCLNAIT